MIDAFLTKIEKILIKIHEDQKTAIIPVTCDPSGILVPNSPNTKSKMWAGLSVFFLGAMLAKQSFHIMFPDTKSVVENPLVSYASFVLCSCTLLVALTKALLTTFASEHVYSAVQARILVTLYTSLFGSVSGSAGIYLIFWALNMEAGRHINQNHIQQGLILNMVSMMYFVLDTIFFNGWFRVKSLAFTLFPMITMLVCEVLWTLYRWRYLKSIFPPYFTDQHIELIYKSQFDALNIIMTYITMGIIGFFPIASLFRRYDVVGSTEILVSKRSTR